MRRKRRSGCKVDQGQGLPTGTTPKPCQAGKGPEGQYSTSARIPTLLQPQAPSPVLGPTLSSISPPPRYGPPTGHASHLKRARPRQPRPPCASLTGHAPLLVHHLHQAHELLQVAIQVSLRECPAVGLLQGLQLLDRDIVAWAFQHVRQDPPQRRVAPVPHLRGVAEV